MWSAQDVLPEVRVVRRCVVSSKTASKRLKRFLSEIRCDTVDGSVASEWNKLTNSDWDDVDTGAESEVAEDTIVQLKQVLEALQGGKVGLIEDVKGLLNTPSPHQATAAAPQDQKIPEEACNGSGHITFAVGIPDSEAKQTRKKKKKKKGSKWN